MEDFNPFDLSAPPKPIEETKTTVKEFEAKPTVHRVSMGPLFHSKITRILAFALSIVLFGLVGYTAMNYYLSQQTTTSQNPKPLVLQLRQKTVS